MTKTHFQFSERRGEAIYLFLKVDLLLFLVYID